MSEPLFNIDQFGIIFVILLMMCIGFAIWFYVSHIYKDKRYAELCKIARTALKRPLSLEEVLTIRLAYHRLDYDTVVNIITGVWEE